MGATGRMGWGGVRQAEEGRDPSTGTRYTFTPDLGTFQVIFRSHHGNLVDLHVAHGIMP